MPQAVIELFDETYDKRLINDFIMYFYLYTLPTVSVDMRAQNRVKLFLHDY
jgi:hypothetical protein